MTTLREMAQSQQRETDRLRNRNRAMSRMGNLTQEMSNELSRADALLLRCARQAGMSLNRYGRLQG